MAAPRRCARGRAEGAAGAERKHDESGYGEGETTHTHLQIDLAMLFS
jgi:hypothetical protein